MFFEKQDELYQWTPLENRCRAWYHYKQAPTDTNRAAWEQAALLHSNTAEGQILKEVELEVEHPHDRSVCIRYHESWFFHNDYSIAVTKHPRYYLPDWHDHGFFEMVYVLEGGCENLLGNQVIPLEAGDFWILPPNQPHTIRCNRDDGIVINILIRKSTFLQSFQCLLSDFGPLSAFFSHTLFQKENDAYLLFRCGKDNMIRTQIQQMYDEYISNSRYSHCILSGQLTILLGTLLRGHQYDVIQYFSRVKHESTQVTRILQYISDHLVDVSLQSVSREFGYCTSRCSIILKDATGKSFTDIVRDIRIHRATQLLVSTDWSMTQIAEELGFYDTSHFYRFFSSAQGVTPTQYRKGHLPKK